MTATISRKASPLSQPAASGKGWLPIPPAYGVAGAVCWSAAIGGLDSATGQGLFCLTNCALLVWLILSPGYSPSVLRRTRLLFGLLIGAWLWSIVATWYFIGAIPEEAYARLARNFGAMAMLLSGLVLSRIPRQGEKTLDWIAILLATISLFAILSWSVDPMTITWSEGLEKDRRFQGFVGNVNVNATLAAVAALWSGWRALRVWSTWYRWTIKQRLISVALVGTFVINSMVVVLSATRFVNITLCVILLIGLAGHLLRQRTRFRPSWRHYAIVGCLFVAIIASQWFGLLPGRYETLGEGVTARLAIWRQCFVMFFERPLSGYGLAAFPAVYAHFLPDPRTAARIWTVNSPHDVVFQLLLTGGVVYLVLIELAAVFVAMPIFLAIRRGSARTGDRVLCVMVLIMLGSASIDITLDYPLSIGIFGLLTGLLLGQSLYRRKIPITDPGLEPLKHETFIRGRAAKPRKKNVDRPGIDPREPDRLVH
jgi:O-antigen ligase